MVRASHLTKCFGTFTALTDVSFEVAAGEIVGFLGPNGAGKSTTLRILSGVFPPTSGTAEVSGFDVAHAPLQARACVGYFPERVALYFDMSVREYLRYVVEMKGVPAAQRRDAIDRAMQACAIDRVAHRLIGNLSKGYRQRVGIAQALVGQPKVLILDEPTSGLDPEQVAEMRHLIRGLRGDSTVIVSSHILSEVEATCDRVIIINRGRILAVDTPRNLQQRLRQTSEVYAEVLATPEQARTALRNVAGIVRLEAASNPPLTTLTISTEKNRDARAEIAAALSHAGIDLLELRAVTASLEDIFLSLLHNPATATNQPISAAPL